MKVKVLYVLKFVVHGY